MALSQVIFVTRPIAKTPASTQISSAVGSGPFILVKEEWRPGSQAVYVRNPADRIQEREYQVVP